VFQGFKDWGSLSTVWLLTSFIFFFAALLWFAASFFFITLLRHTHFILDVTFSSDLGMPPSIWVSWALISFWLSHSFFSFLIEIFSCLPVWGVILVGIFFMKEKLFRLKKGSQGMYLFQNVKGITKMAFPHFKRKQLWSINFDLVKCDGLIFAKMHFMGHEQRVHYIPLFIHLKTHDSRVMG